MKYISLYKIAGFLISLIVFLSCYGCITTPPYNPKTSLSEAITQLLRAIPPGKTIAFVQLTSSGGEKSRLADEMYQRIEPLLIERGNKKDLRFIERRNIKLIIDEWELDSSQFVDGGQDMGARRLLGADLILTGKASIDSPYVRVNLKLTSLEDGRIASAAEGFLSAKKNYYQWEKQKPINPTIPDATPKEDKPPKDNNIRLWANASTYRIGELLTLYFEVSQPMYVTIIDVTPAGEVNTLFPNTYQRDNFCKPGVQYQVPPDNAQFALKITGPKGIDRIKAIGSTGKSSFVSFEVMRGAAITEKLINTSSSRVSITIEIY